MATYGDSFGDVWRNAFAEDRARDASVAAATDRLLSVISARRAENERTKEFNARQKMLADDMKLRREIFEENMRRQREAESQVRAGNLLERERFALAQRTQNWREQQQTPAELYTQERAKREAEAKAQENRAAKSLADMLNRQEKLEAELGAMPTEQSIQQRTTALNVPLWPFDSPRAQAETEATLALAQMVPPTQSTYDARAPITSVIKEARAPLERERTTLQTMIDNMTKAGYGDMIVRGPQGWTVAGDPAATVTGTGGSEPPTASAPATGDLGDLSFAPDALRGVLTPYAPPPPVTAPAVSEDVAKEAALRQLADAYRAGRISKQELAQRYEAIRARPNMTPLFPYGAPWGAPSMLRY